MPALVNLQATHTAPTVDFPRPDRLVSGNPQRTTWLHHDNPHSGVACGIWACEPGAWRIAFPANKEEYFHVLEGRLTISDEHGHGQTFSAGQGCVIPAGFTGTFTVHERVRKHFVVIETPEHTHG